MNADEHQGGGISRRARRVGAAVFAASFLLAACRGRESGRVETRTGELTIEAALEPDPPRQKGNKLELTIRDAQGKPVEAAEVGVEARMPAMAGMSEMRSRAAVVEHAPGRYAAEFDLPMSGSWRLEVAVQSAAATASAEYSLTVGRAGLEPLGATARTAAAPTAASSTGEPGEVSRWTCSMHTHVRSEKPGQCPICSMDLVPVTRAEVESGEIFVDTARRQTIGVRTGPVVRRPVQLEIRAVGKVAYDETSLAEVSVKYTGWIGRLQVDSTGQAVRRGETLFTLYSPELYSAQQEFLAALRSQQAARATSAPGRADYLVEAARQRLRLWDIQDRQIEEIARAGQPTKFLPIASPVSGHVIEKTVVEGAAVEPGMKLYRIAGLDRVWVEAEVYESELSLVVVGQEAEVTLPYLPGRTFSGKVSFVYPYLASEARTGRARIELPNPRAELKPDMYAEVLLRADLGEKLVVPESAVLFAGKRRLVFLDLGEGRLKPTPIVVGVESGDDLEVLSGLDEGDVVVTSGTFLVAAESRLKSATGQWEQGEERR